MIELNGKLFAESESEFTDSLFTNGSTCVGYAKRLKRQIKLFDHQRNLIGMINKHGVLCGVCHLPDGDIVYGPAVIDIIGRFESMSDETDQVLSHAIGFDLSGSRITCRFK